MNKVIFWFHQDLSQEDNPGLYEACNRGEVLPIYIWDDTQKPRGAASQWWLHHALVSLDKGLKNSLNIYKGKADEILEKLLKEHTISAVFWNRCYEPLRIAQDTRIKTHLKEQGITCISFQASLLWEPWTILKNDRTPYTVFSPFYKAGCLKNPAPRLPLGVPSFLKLIKDPKSQDIKDLKLLPTISWYKSMENCWDISEQGAHNQLSTFMHQRLNHYKEGRNFPDGNNTSVLSPYLHFGQISPHQVWHTLAHQRSLSGRHNVKKILTELAWRDFAYYLLYHFPDSPSRNFFKKFDSFPWINNPVLLKAWQKGQTGYPIIDAGMRELWQTGYMHNRVRMIVASFLVKNLLIDWRHGADWFWDCLVDADLANNTMNWQWVAGCGVDPAPYFRIFNPITQGEKFDPEGIYIKRFVPELGCLPTPYLFNPTEAPKAVLDYAKVILGQTYPYAVVDLKTSRQKALQMYSELA